MGVELPVAVDAPPAVLDVTVQLASASTTSSSATQASQIEEPRKRKGEVELNMRSIPFSTVGDLFDTGGDTAKTRVTHLSAGEYIPHPARAL